MVEHNLGPRGPEVELIGGKIFSVRHAAGRLLASIARSEYEVESIKATMKELNLITTESDVHEHCAGSSILLTIGEGLQFYTLANPHKTGSSGSEAVYIATGEFQDCIFLAQYMQSNSRSSWHSHPSGEHFVNRDGNAFKFEDNVKAVSKLGEYKYVPADERHLVYTLGESAFNLILNEGTDFNHNIVGDRERPSIEELRKLTIEAGLYPIADRV